MELVKHLDWWDLGLFIDSPAIANGLGGVWNLFSMEGKEGRGEVGD